MYSLVSILNSCFRMTNNSCPLCTPEWASLKSCYRMTNNSCPLCTPEWTSLKSCYRMTNNSCLLCTPGWAYQNSCYRMLNNSCPLYTPEWKSWKSCSQMKCGRCDGLVVNVFATRSARFGFKFRPSGVSPQSGLRGNRLFCTNNLIKLGPSWHAVS